jgi:dipeptidyl aminopeptidase/acylaminoacyl peptidase
VPPHADRPERIAVTAAGDAAAFVIGAGPRGSGEATGLWHGPLGGQPARLDAVVPDTNLAFAPDGPRFALAVQDEAGSTVIVADPAQAPSGWPRYPLPAFAEQVAWTEAGLIVLAADPGADAASLTSGKPLPGGEQDPVVLPPGGGAGPAGFRRLWRVDPGSGEAAPVSPEDLAIWEFAPVPGGGAIVVASDDPTEAGWYHSRLEQLDAAGGRRRVLLESAWQLSSPAVSPDGRVVACIEGWASDRGLLAGEVRLLRLDQPGPAPAAVTLTADLDVTWLSWAGGGRLWLAGWHHLGTAWGWAEPVKGAGEVGGGALALAGAPGQALLTVQPEAASCLNSRWHPSVVPLADGSALTMRSTPATPPQVVRLRRGSEAAAWTALNAGLAESRRLRVRELRWAGPDETPIEGLLAEPDDGRADAGEAGPRPLVVDIHGGPSLAFHHSWDMTWAELLTGAGYAVLMPNPRGGAGRGQAFGRANLGDPAGAEFADIEAGVAHCVTAGLADPGRVAAIGASYGGYLTAWAIALGGQFRCGVVIAGMSDLVSVRGTANNAPFYDYLLQGRPADQPARYLDRSPVTRLSAGSSPALILHGREDRCVPVSQAEELYAGLREFGIPAEFVSYPREGHQATEPAHVADQRERILRWLATYLETAPRQAGTVQAADLEAAS